jgi:hypothetical protein
VLDSEEVALAGQYKLCGTTLETCKTQLRTIRIYQTDALMVVI